MRTPPPPPSFFFSFFFISGPISESNHEAAPAPISVLQLEKSSDGRATLAPHPPLPRKTEGKEEVGKIIRGGGAWGGAVCAKCGAKKKKKKSIKKTIKN